MTPRWDAYKRFDVVFFNPPSTWVDANGSPFIKRVIGVGGVPRGTSTVRATSAIFHHAVANMVDRTQLDRQGRLVIPARIRAAAGLAPGKPLAVRTSHGRVIVEPLDAIERKMWRAAARARAGDATAELLEDRRREANHDQAG